MNKIFQNQFTALILLLSLVSLWSCNEDDNLGAEILPDDDFIDVQYLETSNIKSYTVKDSKIKTNGFSKALLGSYIDPFFGATKAEFATQVRLRVSKRVNENTVPDSMMLEMFTAKYKIDTIYQGIDTSMWVNTYYGKLGNPQTISIYRLTEDLPYIKTNNDGSTGETETQPFYADTEFAHESEPLVEHTYIPQHRDSLVKIKLPLSLAEKFINAGIEDSTCFDENDKFFKFFKGLLFKTDEDYKDGAIVSYDLTNIVSRMILYFHSKDDTISQKMIFSLGNTYSGRAGLFKHDYSETNFNNQIENPEQIEDTTLYLQSMAGLKAKLYFPELENLKSYGDKLIVNKAQLVVPMKKDLLNRVYNIPGELKLLYENSDGEEQMLNEYYNPKKGMYLGEKYNKQDESYVFSIPKYIQDIIHGKIEDNGLFIIPNSRNSSSSRAMLNSCKHPTKPIKLKITYTIL